jgi:non-ribosomal peptide synthetase component F
VNAEVFELYEAARAGRPPELAPVHAYRDYISWLASRDTAAAEGFWRERLIGFAAPTPLPIAGDVPTGWATGLTQTATIATTWAGLGQKLEQAARRYQTTVSTLIYLGWGLLLSRYSGQDDVLFGSTVSGRQADVSGIEHMVGPLINTVAIRIQLRDGEGVEALVSRFHRELTSARAYEHVALAQVQKVAQVPAGTPLFHSLLLVENIPWDPSTTANESTVGITEVRQAGNQTNFPLSLAVVPARDSAVLVYDQRLFEAEDIAQLLTHFERVLHAVATTPDVVASQIQLLDDAEERRVMVEWNERK